MHPDPFFSCYASYLKKLYTSMTHSHTSQHWPPLPRCEFLQLAMIGGYGLRRGGPEEEMIRLAQLGKIETIISHKEPIELHNLFQFPPSKPQPLVVLPPPPSGRVCLIEGAPGGGKSTLALHICHQWAQLEGASWLKRFDAVILAYLRDEAVQNARTLADILPARNLEMSQRIASQLQATDGKNILFVFDGWDEFPKDLMNNSLVSTIIQHAEKVSLHQSTVLITSRPVASGNLLHIADRRVEILGFTQHQIHEYIEKALDGNSTDIQKLVQHLEDHPVIEGYCYIPLHSAILVHVFLTMKGSLPTTLHELFSSLVLCCIVREQATREPSTILPELSSLDDLPDDLKSNLSNLCVLAYNGVMESKIVFNSIDLKKSHLPTILPSLGILQAIEGLTLTSKSLSYNFLHLSVQELLAAYHISQMTSSKQVEVFKELFGSSRFEAVLYYYCGFTKLNNPEIQEFISSYQHNKFELTQILPLLRCFFEAQQPSLCQLVDPKFIPQKHHDFNLNKLSPLDVLAMGYFITSILATSTADVYFLIHVTYRSLYSNSGDDKYRTFVDLIDNHRFKLLLCEFSKYPVEGVPTTGALSKKLALDLYTPSITEQGAKLLASHLKKSTGINELILVYGHSSRASSVDDRDSLVQIAEALQANSSLTKFSIQGRYILPDSFSCCLFKSLQHNTHLVCLEINIVSSVAAVPIANMLRINKSLTHIDFSSNTNFSDAGAHHIIFEGLLANTTLTNLNLSKIGLTTTDLDTAQCLTKILQVNKSLTHLDLSFNNLSDSGGLCIFEGLQHNTTLTSINLRNNDITATNPDTAESLTKMLQVNKSLVHLDLSSNELSDAGGLCIFEGLQHNTTLTSINLKKTSITATNPDTAMSLTKMLQVNNSLTYLNLSSKCPMPDDQIFSHIFRGLEHNTTLSHLVLRDRNITFQDAECIAHVLMSNQCSLQIVDLSHANATNESFCLILDSLKFNSTFKKLLFISKNRETYFKPGALSALDLAVSNFKKEREVKGLPPIEIVLKEIRTHKERSLDRSCSMYF